LLEATLLAVAVLAPVSGCNPRPEPNTDLDLQHRGNYGPAVATVRDSFTVVSYNIQYGENVDAALVDLNRTPYLADADVLLLQEMDPEGAERMARELGYNYVYQAASLHPHHDRLFGNAVLSRWPIVGQRLLVLPHPHPVTGHRRIAVVADLDVAGLPVRAVSVHVATVIRELDARLDQATAALDSLADVPGPVIIGGDFNTLTDYGRRLTMRLFRKAGFRRAGSPTSPTVRQKLWLWPSQRLVLDHVFTRDLELGAAGVFQGATASDHYPLWARFGFPRRE
jgi:endonuclease/exonuclease/phosphatase family metal-dependent hydrolase